MKRDITVFMPTYKQAKYLDGAIQSILNQEGYKDRIHISICNARRDFETGRLLLSYAGGRSWPSWITHSMVDEPDLWRQKQTAMMEGCKWSDDDMNDDSLVCRFDSDDIMCDGWFQKAIPIAREIQSRGKIPIIGPSFRLVDEKLNPLQDIILPEFSMDKMLESCIIPEYSIMPVGPMLGVGGFYPEDYPKDVPDRYRWYAMMLRMLKKYDCEVKLLPDIGFLYRQHKKAAHNRFNSKFYSKKNVRNLKEVARYYYPEKVK